MVQTSGTPPKRTITVKSNQPLYLRAFAWNAVLGADEDNCSVVCNHFKIQHRQEFA